MSVSSRVEWLTRICETQENGGRKPRRILQNAAGDMDLMKVVEWVCNSKLENVVQNNDPTGQAKLKKVRLYFSCL